FDFNNDGIWDDFSITGVIRHNFADNGDYPVTVLAVDNSGASAPVITDVLVRNVAPTLSHVALTPSIAEGGTATLTGNVSDSGALDSSTLAVSWGDGSMPQPVAPA